MNRAPQKSRVRSDQSYTIGREKFAKISAVEGIQLTAAMVEDFHEFERKGLSPEQRRTAIAKKYGKAR